ncbi:hypothetical protein THIAE_08080 [Thiomicrospira aerophila AL3]|uniref:Uncharacterized protein n=1 Tax=Thiomicrospira aerophila AL3 TaxID=717772 RepID=W0DUS5_9GAMM|nr:hypothetical protein THIAE_08080 [Thiomicrospira aerophila AL3]
MLAIRIRAPKIWECGLNFAKTEHDYKLILLLLLWISASKYEG